MASCELSTLAQSRHSGRCSRQNDYFRLSLKLVGKMWSGRNAQPTETLHLDFWAEPQPPFTRGRCEVLPTPPTLVRYRVRRYRRERRSTIATENRQATDRC